MSWSEVNVERTNHAAWRGVPHVERTVRYAIGDDAGQGQHEAGEDPLRHLIVGGPVLRAVEDFDEIAFIWLVPDLTRRLAEAEQPLDGGAVGRGDGRLHAIATPSTIRAATAVMASSSSGSRGGTSPWPRRGRARCRR